MVVPWSSPFDRFSCSDTRLRVGSNEFLSALEEPAFVGGEVVMGTVFTTLIAQMYFKPMMASFVTWVTNTGQNAGAIPLISCHVCWNSPHRCRR